jgi:hypothetical protein
MPSAGLIRFAKLTVLIANALTIVCAILIFGWQITVFLRDGSWRALPLSFVLNPRQYGSNEVFLTASIDKVGESQSTGFVDALLHVPTSIMLLLGVAFLTAFYSWLSNIEKRTGT